MENGVAEEHSTNSKLIIVMVGLPARGKSYVSKKLCRYLNWLQYETTIFNVGNRRRKVVLQSAHSSNTHDRAHTSSDNQAANFFDPENVAATKLREQVALETLDEAVDHLVQGGGSVAIFDATNSTIERRNLITRRIRQRSSEIQVMFLESQCFDKAVSHIPGLRCAHNH